MTYAIGFWLMIMVHIRVIYGNNLYGETKWQRVMLLMAFFTFMTFYCQHKTRVADPGIVKPKTEGRTTD